MQYFSDALSCPPYEVTSLLWAVAGADESKVVPNHGGRDVREGEDLEGSTSRKAPESPPKTPRRSLDQALATPERVPSTPLNPSKTSAFSAFMSPQRPAGLSKFLAADFFFKTHTCLQLFTIGLAI